jgi:hypothetical protein
VHDGEVAGCDDRGELEDRVAVRIERQGW